VYFVTYGRLISLWICSDCLYEEKILLEEDSAALLGDDALSATIEGNTK
jgi:hypothetical protein